MVMRFRNVKIPSHPVN